MVFVVEIEDRTSPKPFLGGWRDVDTNVEYYDAVTQTPLKPWPRNLVSRLVQTSAQPEQRSRSVMAGGIERAVQAGPVPFPELGESTIWVKDVVEARRRVEAAVKIQRFFRAHRSRQSSGDEEEEENEGGASRSFGKFVDVSEADNDLDEDRSDSVTKSYEYRSAQQLLPGAVLAEFHHLIQPSDVAAAGPRDGASFAVLRSLLDRWSSAEEARMRASGGGDEGERLEKLEKEIELLRAIETARRGCARRRAERARARFLDELAKPIKVTRASDKGKRTLRMETLSVQRAREFRDLYETLLAYDELVDDDDEAAAFNEDKRVELLFGLKKIVAQHTCASSSSLEGLIDQELFLLSSRVEPARLKHLRSRVRLGFLRLAHGALRHHETNRIKVTATSSMKRTRLCPSCGRLRRLEAFETDHRERISRTCVDCAALRPRRMRHGPEVCLEIYEGMLKELRRNEAARPDSQSSLAFVIGPKAIRYLVNDIWHGRSAISECDDLGQLRLVRLDAETPWSPWNTLLATRREARMHEELVRNSTPAVVYDDELLRKLKRMNLQARLYFESLAKTSDSGLSL